MKVNMCEICEKHKAIGKFKRTWHDGSVDEVSVCLLDSKSDDDGMWKMEKLK